jgi:CDGSH-type Zn-finger protein
MCEAKLEVHTSMGVMRSCSLMNAAPLANVRPRTSLHRCGLSVDKPFCDGSLSKAAFAAE